MKLSRNLLLRLFLVLSLVVYSRQYAYRLDCTDDKSTRLVVGGYIMDSVVKDGKRDPEANYSHVSITIRGADVNVSAVPQAQFVVRAFGAEATLKAPHHNWNATGPYLTATDDRATGGPCPNQLYLETGMNRYSRRSAINAVGNTGKMHTYSFKQFKGKKLVVGYALGESFGVYIVSADIK
jgi:hypothetical protein